MCDVTSGISTLLTGGLSDVAKGLGMNTDAANSFSTLGLSDVFGTGGPPSLGNLGKSGFQATDKLLGTGNLNQDIGTGLDYIIPAVMGAGALSAAAAPAEAGAGITGAGDIAASNAANLAASQADLAGLSTDASGLITAPDAALAPDAAGVNALPSSLMTPSPGAPPAGLAPSDAFSMGGSPGASAATYGAQPNAAGGGIWDFLSNNKMGLGMLGLNAANAFNKSSMQSGLNDAQQNAYNNYLAALNPSAAVKQARYNTLASNVDQQSGLAARKLGDTLGARGIRGKGAAAPYGDLNAATNQSLEEAYNQIYGTYNVPGSPGPANYAPNALQTGIGDVTQSANYLVPLMAMLSKYGGGGNISPLSLFS